MIEIYFTKEQLEKMKILNEYHLEKHKEKQTIMAMSEFAELIHALSKSQLNKTYSLQDIHEEIFDAYMTLLQMYQIYVVEHDLENIFKIIVNNKIERELWRWNIDRN